MIKKIEIKNAFEVGNNLTLNCNDDLTVIYKESGRGKTTMFDTLHYLFTDNDLIVDRTKNLFNGCHDMSNGYKYTPVEINVEFDNSSYKGIDKPSKCEFNRIIPILSINHLENKLNEDPNIDYIVGLMKEIFLVPIGFRLGDTSVDMNKIVTIKVNGYIGRSKYTEDISLEYNDEWMNSHVYVFKVLYSLINMNKSLINQKVLILDDAFEFIFDKEIFEKFLYVVLDKFDVQIITNSNIPLDYYEDKMVEFK